MRRSLPYLVLLSGRPGSPDLPSVESRFGGVSTSPDSILVPNGTWEIGGPPCSLEYADRVLGEERFWTRRLRWRLRGAWMWPTFAILTIAEGFVLHKWPPTGFRIDDVVIGAILALFGNLFFVGVVAPWVARRLIERD